MLSSMLLLIGPSFSLNKSSIQCSYSCSTHIEQKDQILCQVVAYKRFKRMENYLNYQPKMGSQLQYRNRLFTRGSNCKVLTWKSLVFWMGGCFKRLYYDNTGNKD